MGSSRVTCTVLLALAGCPTVDLGDQPPDLPLCSPAKGYAYFVSDIWPKYITNTKKSCLNGGPQCHAVTGGLLILASQMPDMTNYEKVRAELNCSFTTASRLYSKPCGLEPHSGGQIFNCPNDPQPQDFLAWFQ